MPLKEDIRYNIETKEHFNRNLAQIKDLGIPDDRAEDMAVRIVSMFRYMRYLSFEFYPDMEIEKRAEFILKWANMYANALVNAELERDSRWLSDRLARFESSLDESKPDYEKTRIDLVNSLIFSAIVLSLTAEVFPDKSQDERSTARNWFKEFNEYVNVLGHCLR